VPRLSTALLARGRLAAASGAICGTVTRRRLARVRRVLSQASSQFRVLGSKARDLSEQCLDHRSEVGDLALELSDPAVAIVNHINGRSHRDRLVDPHSRKRSI
jgi:hypothetical protein